MLKLIEALFSLLTIIAQGIFNLLQVIFGADPEFRKAKYKAGFMKWWDRVRLLNSYNFGICLTGTKKLRVKKSLEHTLIIGGSGVGKTSSVIIPSILRSNASFICTDLDGSIYQATSGALKRKGYNLQVLNLEDISRSECFNPIAYCKNDSDLKELSELLIRTAYPNANAESNYWNYGGQQIIYIMLRVLKSQPKSFHNLANLRFLLQRYNQIEDFIIANASQETYNDYLGFASSEEKIQTGMVSSGLMALDKLSDSGVNFLTSKNTLNFSKLTKGKRNAIFIRVPESKLVFYSFLLSLVYNSFFSYIQRNKPRKIVYAYLDEFAQLKGLGDFPTISTTCRRYNLGLVCLIQSENQLISNFGTSGYQTMFNGSFANKLIFGGMSYSLAQQLSQSFGRKGIAIQPQTQPYLSDRELMSVDELIQLSNKKALFIYRGKPPLIVKVKPYFKQFSLGRKSKIRPIELKQNTIVQTPLLNLNPLTNEEE